MYIHSWIKFVHRENKQFEKDICVGAIVFPKNVCEILDSNMASFRYKQTFSYIYKKESNNLLSLLSKIVLNILNLMSIVQNKNVNLKSRYTYPILVGWLYIVLLRVLFNAH